MSSNYVHGRVRLATASPRVSEYDYSNRSYSPPDYYGGDHFLYRGDPNLLPNGNGMYSSSSPYNSDAITAYPPSTIYSAMVPNMSTGVYGNTEEAVVEDLVGGAAADAAGEEGGFDAIGTIVSVYNWSQSDEGQQAIQMGKDIYDQTQQIGQGGKSNTSYSSVRIDQVPIGEISTPILMEKLKAAESKLVPTYYVSSSEIPEVPKGDLLRSLFGKGVLATIPAGTQRFYVRRYNLIRRELIARFGSLSAAGYLTGGSGGSGGTGGSGFDTKTLIGIGGLVFLGLLALRKK